MTQARTDILKEIKSTILRLAPGAKIYLYGSRALGTARKNSDWDLLILLKKDSITLEDEQKITFPLYDIEFETGQVISPIIYSEKEWNSKYKVTAFFKNVMREGNLL
jgi:predicted nucleotidyltransferase